MIRAYVWAILASHLVVFAFLVDSNALFNLFKDVEPLCWPYLPNCGRYRFESPAILYAIAAVYLSLIIGGGALIGRSFKGAWICILALNALLFGIVSLDYRLRANEFYMLFWLNGVFLFWPHRRWTIPLILISFYFWAGRLKINHEWLSGSVLYHGLWLIPSRLTPAACAYVVVLEMLLIWGLLSRLRFVRLLVLAQLALFHIESLSQINWFYPALMATMLAWFVIEDFLGSENGRPTLAAFVNGRAPKSAYLIMAVFAIFQMVPLLYHGDPTLTGQGRIFALHMFEARQMCEVSATIHRGAGLPETIDIKLPNLPPRIVCDPIVYYSRVENICLSRSADADLLNVDFRMKVKRTTDKDFRTIIDEPQFCSPTHDYLVFSNNSWIK